MLSAHREIFMKIYGILKLNVRNVVLNIIMLKRLQEDNSLLKRESIASKLEASLINMGQPEYFP